MISQALSAVQKELIRFFKSRCPDESVAIDVFTDVRRVCGFETDSAGWRGLAGVISQLPTVSAAGLAIGPSDMDGVSTISQLMVKFHKTSFVTKKSGMIEGARTQRNSDSDGRKVENRGEREDAEYVVWYGTNRKPVDELNLQKGYSKHRDSKTHYGTCKVFVPRSHKIGSVGSPWWERITTWTDDRLKLLATSKIDGDMFWRTIGELLSTVDVDKRDVLIFIHGYNVSFSNAALRAAQIGFDLSIKGVMAFFSWPSQGTLRGYPIDEATIDASESAITDFIQRFSSESRSRKVHIIAHSMGNRGVLRAVDRIVARVEKRKRALFGQIILAAADVDADTFRGLCPGYVQVSQRTTLYVSSRDRAVEASRWIHSFPRAGLLPPIMIVPGIDTINVTNSDLSMLGHGYVAESRDVLQDMHKLIAEGSPPDARFGLQESKTESGERFW